MIDLSKNGPEPNRFAILQMAFETAVDEVEESLGGLTYGEIIGALEIFKADLIAHSLKDDEGEEWKEDGGPCGP